MALGMQAGFACVPVPIPISRDTPITSVTNTSPLPPAACGATGCPSPASTPPPQLPKRSRLWPQHPASCQTPAKIATAILFAWVKGSGPKMGPGSPAPLHVPCPPPPAAFGQPCPGSPSTASRASPLLPAGAVLPTGAILPVGAILPTLPPAPADQAAEPAQRPAPESKVPRP